MKVYRQLTYALQLIASLNVLVALFLPWHTEHGNALELMQRPLEGTLPYSLVSPWVLLWGLPLIGLVSLLRGASGIFDAHAPGRTWAIRTSLLAAIVMGWYYLIFGSEADSLNIIGEIRFGYWLTVSSLLLLTLLILTEWLLPEYDPHLAHLAKLTHDDPERIWEGHYRVCPYCGSPNDPENRRCSFCGITLFHDERKPKHR
ncbi:MAG: zinc ribbon domain-containing protein [Anaerolineales bacterium]|nr:zinc ribbon domain-containing protein [Anaerolineales bacterium]